MNISEIRLDHFVRLCLLAAIGYLTISGIFFKRGWIDWHRIVRQNNQLVASIEVMENKKNELEANIETLKTSARKQEMMVREVLGYVRANETVVEFD